jgi:hypothetical protein
VTDEQDKPVYEKRLPNDLDRIVMALAPYRDELCGVVVESTYNWYWRATRSRTRIYQGN